MQAAKFNDREIVLQNSAYTVIPVTQCLLCGAQVHPPEMPVCTIAQKQYILIHTCIHTHLYTYYKDVILSFLHWNTKIRCDSKLFTLEYQDKDVILGILHWNTKIKM